MATVTCPHCQAPLIEGARFCPACGNATAPTESGASWPAAAGGAPDLLGREIAGRYRIVKKLGEGGMGAVYRGEQMSLKRAVAVKLLKPELGTNQMILQRFNAEAQAVAKLSHPNTVNIYDFGQDADGSLFIAMEYIEGRSLRDAIQKEGPFSPQRALAIALQVAASLSDAHAHSIVHRDLKPDNVMLQERGRQKDVVRVLDFGIAKLRDDSRATQAAMTQAGDMLGTPQYMAPEQIRGESIDGRTDVYALGCMIYEMVTGRLPYEAPSIMAMLSKHLLETPVPPSQRRPELGLSPAIDQLVGAAMAKEPNARPATMDAFAELIGQLLGQLPIDPSVGNRSGAMSLQQGVVGPLVTPPASSFQPLTPPPFAPPMPPPPGPPVPPPPGPVGAPAMPPPPGAYPPRVAPTVAVHGYTPPVASAPTVTSAPAGKSRAPLFIVLGVLALGGGGAGVYFATRSSSKAPSANGTPTGSASDTPSTATSGDDPWATPSTPSIPPATKPTVAKPAPPVADPDPPAPVGTAAMGIPAGASLTPPAGFSLVQNDSTVIQYENKSTGEAIFMAPLDSASNDPAQLAAQYAQQVGAELVSSDTVTSAGAQRPAFMFKSGDGDSTVAHIATVYLSGKWRLAVIYIASVTLAASDGFEAKVLEFFRSGVQLP